MEMQHQVSCSFILISYHGIQVLIGLDPDLFFLVILKVYLFYNMIFDKWVLP